MTDNNSGRLQPGRNVTDIRLWSRHELTNILEGVTEELARRAVLAVNNARLYVEAQRLNALLEHRLRERTAALRAIITRLKNEISDRKQMEAELIEVQRRLMESREAERLHLAQELHDGPLQDLHAMVFRLGALEATLSDQADLGELAATQATLQQVIQTLRSICGEFRPPALAPFGLEKAIRSHADSFQQANPDLTVQLDLMPDGQSLPERMRLALFRIYQHALNNVRRHAGATQVAVRLKLDRAQVILEIEDDGCGFKMPQRWVELARRGHLGLVGAAERAEAVGGGLKVISNPGRGTLIRTVVPRPEQQKE